MRVALITGGSGGLGLATAQRLARDGMTIVVTDLDQESARKAASMLPGEGHVGRSLDVADEHSVTALFEAVEREVGPIGVLACFAGILTTGKPGRMPLTEMSVEEWDRVHAINSRGTFLCIREFARHRQLRGVDHGRIITVSSLAGQIGGIRGGVAYSSSKGAVLAITKVCARELASLGITVNNIAPGPIDTAMMRATVPEEEQGDGTYGAMDLIPLGRVGRAEEIAEATAYLASPEAGFVTGATLDVNGGMRMG